MDYGVCASTATTSDAKSTLPTYFKYADHIDKVDRFWHTEEGWFNLIKYEIDHYRPMLYRIEGHAIVCDGARIIDNVRQYHVNYGWGSNSTDLNPTYGYNAWFTIDNIYNSTLPLLNEYLLRYITPQFDEEIVEVKPVTPDYWTVGHSRSHFCGTGGWAVLPPRMGR